MRAMRSMTGGKIHAVLDNAHEIGIYLLARCGARCITGALEWPPETGDAAIEAAYGLGEASISLCHRCADQVQDPEVEHVTVICGDEEATDRPDPDLRLHDIVRARQALRLWELAERAAVGFPVAGRGQPCPAFVSIWPPLEPGQGWRISLSHGGTFDGASLAEAVEAALAGLGHG